MRYPAAILGLGLVLMALPAGLQAQVPPPGSAYEQLLRRTRPVGSLSANPYLPGSTSAPAARYRPDSPSNPWGRYGSPYAPDGARNPYTNGGLEIYGHDGTYLGRLNANPYDPESVSNPYGPYGSPWSSQSIRNPFGTYGSPYSPYSATNPYASSPPTLVPPSPPPFSLPEIGRIR